MFKPEQKGTDVIVRRTGLFLSVSCGFLASTAALAQQQDGAPSQPSQAGASTISEVVVTAQRRSSTVQQTPISITAVTGADIRARGITSLAALVQDAPGVSLRSSGPGQTEYEIRGLSATGGNSPTVGFYLDDVPLTAPASAENGKVVIEPDLYDLGRVEVLRGPQGTLFGSSAMGGAIRLVSNQPDPTKYDASAQGTLSGTDGGGLNNAENGMVNIPLLDGKAALRIVASEAHTSGWIDRVVVANGAFPLETGNGTTRGDVAAAPVATDHRNVNDENLVGTRITLLWNPVENFTVTPSLFYQRTTQGGYNLFDSDPGALAHYEPYDVAEPFADNFIMGALNAEYRMPLATLHSTTAYWDRREAQRQDEAENLQQAFGFPSFYPPAGLGQAAISETDRSKQFSQELRLTSNGNTRFQWIVGAFYSNFKSDWDVYSTVPGLAEFGYTTDLLNSVEPTKISQVAGFGEGSYRIIPTLTLTLGLRYYYYTSQLNTSINGFVGPTGTNDFFYAQGSENNHGALPKVNLSYEPNRDLTIYGTASEGFRPGGGNQPIPISGSALGSECLASLNALGRNSAPTQFGPDSLWSFELGEKARLFNNRLTFNSDVYYERWNGIQQSIALSCGFPYNDNAGTAGIYGTEVEAKYVIVPGLTLSTNLGYVHARIIKGSEEANTVVGDQIQDSPDWTGSIFVNYTHDLPAGYRLDARVENSYVGTRVEANYSQFQRLPSYDLTNLRVSANKANYSVALFVNNILNKKAWLSYNDSLSLNMPEYSRVATNQPLTIGLDFNYHFNP